MGNVGMLRSRMKGAQENQNNPIMELNRASKTLQGKAGELEKGVKAEKLKVRRAMERGDMQEARIHAENAVRKHRERTRFLQLSAQLDAVVDDPNALFGKTTGGNSVDFILKYLKSYINAGNLQKLSEMMDQLERKVKFGRQTTQLKAIEVSESEDRRRFAGEDIRSQVNYLMEEVNSAYESDKEVDRGMKEVRSEQVADEFAKEVDQLMQEVADESGLEM